MIIISVAMTMCQIIEVGVSVVRLVTAEHVGVWLLHMQKQQSPDDHQQFTKCRPWTSFHGQEFTNMFQKMQDAVLFYIMDYPGVTLVSQRASLSRKLGQLSMVSKTHKYFSNKISSQCVGE